MWPWGAGGLPEAVGMGLKKKKTVMFPIFNASTSAFDLVKFEGAGEWTSTYLKSNKLIL